MEEKSPYTYKREKQRFSIRKTKAWGACSVFLGTSILFLSAGTVARADTTVGARTSRPQVVGKQQTVPGSTGQQQQQQTVPGSTGQQQQQQTVPGSTGQQQQQQTVPGSTGQQQQQQTVPGSTGQQQQQQQQQTVPGISSPTDRVNVTKDNFLDYFSLNGSATYDQNSGIVTITPDEYNKVGNFSLKSKIDMNKSFTLTGKVNLGSNSPYGADGIGVAFHNGNTTDIGNAGGNLGIGGLQNALGFKLDTWTNTYKAPQSDKDGSQIDPTDSNGFGWNGDSMNAPYGTFVKTENDEVPTDKDKTKTVQRWWAKDVPGTSQALSKSDVNGQFHDFIVDYDGDTRTLTIKYTPTDGKVLTWTTTVPNSDQEMAMIVSASTGGAKNLQQLKIISFGFKRAATVNVKYVDTKGKQIAQGDVTYPNGAKVNGTYTTGQLEIPGYTFVRMDDGTATGAKSLPATGSLTKAGDNGTVIYVYTADKQKGSVSYVDDTTGKTLKTDSISGITGSKSSYSTSGSIADYKKQGYELVTDGYPADLTFDNDDTTDQNFTVHLKHQKIQSTEAKTVNETIHYQGAGSQTPVDHTASVDFTRQVSTDAVTGEKTYGSWSADQSFAAVTSPELKGYTADKAQIDKQTVNGDSKDLEFTVTYTKNAPTITTEKKTVNETIHYQGAGNQTPADHTASVDFARQVSTDAVTGEKTYGPWSAAQSFDAVTSPELKGYIADKAQIDKQTVNGDSKDLEFTVTYTKNAPTITTEKKTVNETVSYVDQNGHVVAQPHTASVDFTRQVSTDAVTGEKTYGSWSAAQSFDAVTSPELKGYTADKAQIDKQTVNGDSKDLEFTVTYTKNAPTITTEKKTVNETVSYVDQNGHVVAQPHTDSVNFTRTVVVDNVTGEVITSGAGTTAWTATNGDTTFDAVVSPVVPGSVADKAQTAAVTGLNADSADVNETVTYTKVGSLVPSSSDGNFPGARPVVYPNDQSDATKVTPAGVPTVPGYTAHDPEGNVLTSGSSYQPSDPTKDTTITYTADKQEGSVSYVDDTTGKTLKMDSISGTTGSKSSYSTSGSIADYKKHGYELVTDGYPADLTFDNDDTTDQNFMVHLKHQNIQSTEAKTVKETIHYQGAGNQTPADNTAQVSFTRQVSTDAVTGEKTYGSWSADQSFAAVTSPVIKGYTPDQAEIGAQTVSGDASDLDFTVVYTKDAPTKPVNPSQPTTPAKPVNPSQPATPTKPVQAGQAAATNFVNQRLPQTGETDQQHMTLSGLLLLAMSSLLGLFRMTKRQRK
ncbi:mucin-binding protein [Lactobacillus delbrueckii]|uniref:mucin-binding protein n=2 Tax=Lactobacillus delbrueckii TaxID=1584 RepID=UPI001E5B6746|nr:MucBP domain-containing protein [Lactobacillus delbrueckii]MCD5538072.1 MucBP domain-containing protein [Lactobacillus delbrueckii subsp. lactis]